MKVIISQKNLNKALNLAEKIVGKNGSLPILNNILIKTENGSLKISDTNLEMGINCYIGAKIEEIGELTVPARIFSDFINGISVFIKILFKIGNDPFLPTIFSARFN